MEESAAHQIPKTLCCTADSGRFDDKAVDDLASVRRLDFEDGTV
jgi:hypothetical protein